MVKNYFSFLLLQVLLEEKMIQLILSVLYYSVSIRTTKTSKENYKVLLQKYHIILYKMGRSKTRLEVKEVQFKGRNFEIRHSLSEKNIHSER